MDTLDEEALANLLLLERLRHDHGRGVRAIKDHQLRVEAAARIPENASRPRFVVCEGWMHPFADNAPEEEVRWVFDRQTWCLAAAQVKAPVAPGWTACSVDDARDLEESLVLGNPEALTDISDWEDCLESKQLPSWVSDAVDPGGADAIPSVAREPCICTDGDAG